MMRTANYKTGRGFKPPIRFVFFVSTEVFLFLFSNVIRQDLIDLREIQVMRKAPGTSGYKI